MSTAANHITESTPDDETQDETPLLSRGSHESQKPTSLPIFQTLVLISVRLADSIAFNSITPYINQNTLSIFDNRVTSMIGELPIVGGDGRKVGYYTGITMSAYFAAEAAIVLQWNRLSDRVGRKPILLSGLLGTTVSITMFGLSHSSWKLALCRFLSGALNGNIGVMKSVLTELTDDSNLARGFSLLPLVPVAGHIIGPFIGGVLSRPQDRWPDSFSHPFWSEYPYFLPCLVVAVISFTQFAITAIFFEEPLRALLTRPVLTSVANYASLALLDIAAVALMPLVWSTPIALGGLGLTPASIGLSLSAYGCASALFQLAFFPRLVAHFGPGRVVVTSIAAFAAFYILFPFENALARRGADVTAVVWPLIALQLLSRSVTDMGFGAVFMFLSSAPPNKRSLGATNGLAQTVVSVQRTVGPTVAVSLFAYSLQNNVLGGQFAYVVLLSLVGAALRVATQLPRDTWKHTSRESSFRFTDSIASNSITLYINQIIGELPIVGGDGRKLSAFYAAEAATVLQWNRLSDRVRRKPILLSGLLRTTVSRLALWYAFSETPKYSLPNATQPFLEWCAQWEHWRFEKCAAELTDDWGSRYCHSSPPLIGGVLPQDRWPDTFSHLFWSEFPYFLPCLVAAVLSLTQFALTAIFFEEIDPLLPERNDDALTHRQDAEAIPQREQAHDSKRIPLRALLTRPVLTSVANYASLALLDIAAGALMPLVWSTPITLGGLGLTPVSIGL
ncbi:major facilitator superfamily domain-containing protein [Lactarius sanguifluus]|nr:major facilitator superfamily domain-containing protein [Lactarius sanguifluus]